jgi:hypothetical protein
VHTGFFQVIFDVPSPQASGLNGKRTCGRAAPDKTSFFVAVLDSGSLLLAILLPNLLCLAQVTQKVTTLSKSASSPLSEDDSYGSQTCGGCDAEKQELAGWSVAANKIAADQAAEVAMVRKAIADAAEMMKMAGNNDLRIMSLDDGPAYYADGHRSILDIHDAIAAEYIPIPLNIIEVYFRLLEKAGVMDIAEDGSAVPASTRN